MSRAPTERRFWSLAAVALLLNLGLLYFYYTPAPKRLIGDEGYYYRHALLIAQGQRVPYNLLWPPLYSELLGLLFSVFGPHRIVVQLVQIGLWLMSAWFFKEIVARVCSDAFVISCSAFFFLFSLELIAFSHYLWPETLHQFFWLLALWLLICRPHHCLTPVLAGAALGLALLTKSLLTLFIPVVALFVLPRRDEQIRLKRRVVAAALMIGAILLVTVPVMVNNFIIRGEFVIANSSVFNLWVGLNDVEKVDYRNDIAGRERKKYMEAGSTLQARNLLYTAKIRGKIHQEGWSAVFVGQLRKQYFRLFDYQTFFTSQLAGGGRQAYASQSQRLITILTLYSVLTYGVVLIAGAAGVCFLRSGLWEWPQCFRLFIVYNLLLFLFLHVKTRYVIQFLPILMFFASLTVYALTMVVRGAEPWPADVAVNKSRVICGITLGVLMGIFVFHSVL